MLVKAQGFSLLEMLVVLCVSAWIATSGTAAWQAWHNQQQARRYMESLFLVLQTARVHAIAKQRLVRVCPGVACDGKWGQDPTVLLDFDVNQNAWSLWQSSPQAPSLHRLSYNRPWVEFRADGGLNALQNGTFIYCVPEQDWHISITLSQAGRLQHQWQPQPCPLR